MTTVLRDDQRITPAFESDSPRVWFETDPLGTRAYTDWPGQPMLLADACAMFESLCLRMAAHRSTGQRGSVHCFDFGPLTVAEPVLALIAQACEESAAGHWRIDEYARLVATAGIGWREAVLVARRAGS